MKVSVRLPQHGLDSLTEKVNSLVKNRHHHCNNCFLDLTFRCCDKSSNVYRIELIEPVVIQVYFSVIVNVAVKLIQILGCLVDWGVIN